ncbi:NADP-dependent alcohol dehydrogenase [Hypnocyclicus thermotrophus]|uniref:NADP-dependent alcohol dehydrogenase n=1 Tax=Hypnocyclicus thermotrophus TaxID=1627895 RepID=A0AA46E050_9FUSO|nr:iron-containing alcohol dehydrogenase [Hypnocyclicus thermotrophus]TDT72316.1 NADP-dependent alcohol dehydrogenase [Hypnocyclicus thermotrophus]
MFNFDFQNPTKIVFGKDRIKELNKLIKDNARVLITYGGGSVKRFGTFDKVYNAINNGKRVIFEFGGIEPNPKYDTLMKAVDIVKKENIDFLLAVGGGSVMDGTKFINLAANYKGETPENLLYGKFNENDFSKIIPIGTVVTLPATGSEMNSGAVVSHKNGKFPVMSKHSFPKFSILEPELTYTLPKTQVANGIADTFIHTVEQYVTYPVDAKIQDRMAEGILKTLIEIADDCLTKENDYNSRANFMWSATMALNGLIGLGVPQDWATHAMGHELTYLFGIDHGKTLSILQPAIWEVRKDKKRDKLIQYAERVWEIDIENDDEKIDIAINKTREFFEKLGIKTHLSDYGIKEEQIEDIIKSLEAHHINNISETHDLTIDIMREILKKAY